MLSDEQLKTLISILREKEKLYYKIGIKEQDSFSKGFAAGITESINIMEKLIKDGNRIIGRWICPGCGNTDLENKGQCKGNIYLKCSKCGKNFGVIIEKE